MRKWDPIALLSSIQSLGHAYPAIPPSGIFLNGRPEKVRKKQLNEEALEVIWTQDSMTRREMTDYIRELQPENEFGPRTGQALLTKSSQQMEMFYESDVCKLILE